MSFQIVKANDRVTSMIEWFTGVCSDITDFIVGSKIRTKFETIAVEMEAQDFAWYQSIKKAIPIALYQAFDFGLRPAQKAFGNVTFTITTPADATKTIPKGTLVTTGTSAVNTEIKYETNEDAYIYAGATTATVAVTAVYAGSSSNVESDKLTTLPNAITGLSDVVVTNSAQITNGLDVETETERRLRFIDYIATLARGTAKAVEYGARTAMLYDETGELVESVQDAIVYEPFMTDPTKPVGVFECYIYNGSGGTTDELKTAAENAINGYNDADGNPVPGWKAAGVICNVIKATETTINVTATITLLEGYNAVETETTATDIAETYIAGLGIGKEFIYNELVERLMGIQGVYNVDITSPAGDQTPAYNQVYIPGTMDISAS